MDNSFEQKAVFKRIKEIMGFELDKDLADFLGLSHSSFAVAKSRGTIPWEKIIEKSIGNYNLEYIFFGKGRSLPPKFDLNESEFDEKKSKLFFLIQDYAPSKMIDEIEDKLLKMKEFQENL